jgi:chlorite dismutase
MILTIITPSMSHSWFISHSWYIMNRSWRRLRLELTIILNLEDQIRSIVMDQKNGMDSLHVFNPFLGGKTKSQLGRFVGITCRTL